MAENERGNQSCAYAYNFKMKVLLSYNECLVSTKHATGFATKLPAGGHAKLLHYINYLERKCTQECTDLCQGVPPSHLSSL